MAVANDRPHPLGSRVKLVGDGRFPDASIGTISDVPVFVRAVRAEDGKSTEWLSFTEPTLRGEMLVQWVDFDVPTDDGSGGGPYAAAGIRVEKLLGLD